MFFLIINLNILYIILISSVLFMFVLLKRKVMEILGYRVVVKVSVIFNIKLKYSGFTTTESHSGGWILGLEYPASTLYYGGLKSKVQLIKITTEMTIVFYHTTHYQKRDYC